MCDLTADKGRNKYCDQRNDRFIFQQLCIVISMITAGTNIMSFNDVGLRPTY